MTTIRTCPHGNEVYSGCAACAREHESFTKARKAYEALSRDINGGDQNITAAAIAQEHPYLLDKLAGAVALATIVRGTYDHSLCRNPGTIYSEREPHPEHDGRFGCGTIIGALRTLAIKSDDDVLEGVRFWKSRMYQPL